MVDKQEIIKRLLEIQMNLINGKPTTPVKFSSIALPLIRNCSGGETKGDFGYEGNTSLEDVNFESLC